MSDRHHHHDPILHLNTNRNDDLLAVVRHHGNHPDATAARADRVDPEGIDVTVTTPHGTTPARIAFPEPVTDFPAGVRVAFVRLARQANSEGPPPDHQPEEPQP